MAWLAVNKESKYGHIFDGKPQRVGVHWGVIEDIYAEI